NVYNQQYESGAQFWPGVHGRIVTALVISQILLIGLLSTQEAEQSTVALLPLPVLTIWFHYVCKGRFEPAYIKCPLQAGGHGEGHAATGKRPDAEPERVPQGRIRAPGLPQR
uniref:CSC1/OSCA1-like 7TM region domain-containing protein n=1 Tax=Aegilops tauschii subsp. strangulata TaxID=200361 RepID=A0A453BQ06_AEGTS